MKPVLYKRPEENQYLFYCPACDCVHFFQTAPMLPGWEFNGDMVKPTVRPSIKVTSAEKGIETICHFHIKEGTIEYQGDCTHELAGKTTVVPEWDDTPEDY